MLFHFQITLKDIQTIRCFVKDSLDIKAGVNVQLQHSIPTHTMNISAGAVI